MRLFVFAVVDRATGEYMAPMFFVAPGQAHRAFSDEVNRAASDNNLYQHPDDFDMYELGVFDTERGVFDTHLPNLFVRAKNVAIRNTEVK